LPSALSGWLSPRTLEGRKKIAELFVREYNRLTIEAEDEVKRIKTKTKDI
jgi:hypothetical protein